MHRNTTQMLVIGTGLLIGGPAFAKTAMLNWTVYLRAGPGENYAVLDEIEPRSSVEVQNCQGDWCKIQFDGSEGFIKASQIDKPDIHGGAPAGISNRDCFVERVNGVGHGERVRLCPK